MKKHKELWSQAQLLVQKYCAKEINFQDELTYQPLYQIITQDSLNKSHRSDLSKFYLNCLLLAAFCFLDKKDFDPVSMFEIICRWINPLLGDHSYRDNFPLLTFRTQLSLANRWFVHCGVERDVKHRNIKANSLEKYFTLEQLYVVLADYLLTLKTELSDNEIIQEQVREKAENLLFDYLVHIQRNGKIMERYFLITIGSHLNALLSEDLYLGQQEQSYLHRQFHEMLFVFFNGIKALTRKDWKQFPISDQFYCLCQRVGNGIGERGLAQLTEGVRSLKERLYLSFKTINKVLNRMCVVYLFEKCQKKKEKVIFLRNCGMRRLLETWLRSTDASLDSFLLIRYSDIVISQATESVQLREVVLSWNESDNEWIKQITQWSEDTGLRLLSEVINQSVYWVIFEDEKGPIKQNFLDFMEFKNILVKVIKESVRSLKESVTDDHYFSLSAVPEDTLYRWFFFYFYQELELEEKKSDNAHYKKYQAKLKKERQKAGRQMYLELQFFSEKTSLWRRLFSSSFFHQRKKQKEERVFLKESFDADYSTFPLV